MTITDAGNDVFIVRVWREPREDATPELRGVIEHLRSGERRFFRRLTDLTDFIQKRTAFDDQRTDA